MDNEKAYNFGGKIRKGYRKVTNKKSNRPNPALDSYRAKRDFTKTPEPKDKRLEEHENLIFVVQKHDSRSLHYDLRLESNGVLKSWAVPKGFATDPKERHLAIETEDHPMSYANFEGTIPAGEYGAGTVEIWDRGTYKNLKEGQSIEEGIEKGEITVWFDGKKLKGSYALIRTHYGNGDKNWIMVKMRDHHSEELAA